MSLTDCILEGGNVEKVYYSVFRTDARRLCINGNQLRSCGRRSPSGRDDEDGSRPAARKAKSSGEQFRWERTPNLGAFHRLNVRSERPLGRIAVRT